MFAYKWLSRYADWSTSTLPEKINKDVIDAVLMQFGTTPDMELAYAVLAWMTMERIEPWNDWNIYSIRYRWRDSNPGDTGVGIAAMTKRDGSIVFFSPSDKKTSVYVTEASPICNTTDLAIALSNIEGYALEKVPENPLSKEEYLQVAEEYLNRANNWEVEGWISNTKKMFEPNTDLLDLARKFNYRSLAVDTLEIVFLYKDTLTTSLLLKEFPNRECRRQGTLSIQSPNDIDILTQS